MAILMPRPTRIKSGSGGRRRQEPISALPPAISWLESNELAAAYEVVTGRGGRHLFYSIPEGAEIRNSAGKIAPGVDVRGVGGYVVAAPSRTVICDDCNQTPDKHPADCPKSG